MSKFTYRLLYCWMAILCATTAVKGLNDEPLVVPNKRAPSNGFVGMRGKKFADNNYIDSSGHAPYLEDTELNNDISAELDLIEKRAPNMGFQGMRGKKLYEPNQDFYQLKRVPMGFHGMRGKKDMEVSPDSSLPNYYPEQYPWLFEPNLLALKNYMEYEKRAPMGFQGMRGKKDTDDTIVKRAPADVGFFGVRGKKLPSPGSQSGFFGMRGKKYPYEFRGKFVGVRGKKLLVDNDISSASSTDMHLVPQNSQNDVDTSNEHDLLNLLNSRTDAAAVNWQKRKVQNNFYGVRGKKEDGE